MRVLLVEDEVLLSRYLRRGLEAEGYAVDVADDGVDGHWLAINHSYDAIVLDIMLPGLNGYEVCAKVRAAGVWAPILMLTAKDGEWDEAEALDTGADDFLRKPFSMIVLLARLRALTRRGASERPVALTMGRVLVNPGEHRCLVDGNEIDLTATEFSVLEALMRRPGQLVSKAEILAACWDWAFDGDPNIVEVYISHLRRKLGPNLLTTIRGRGYRLDG